MAVLAAVLGRLYLGVLTRIPHRPEGTEVRYPFRFTGRGLGPGDRPRWGDRFSHRLPARLGVLPTLAYCARPRRLRHRRRHHCGRQRPPPTLLAASGRLRHGRRTRPAGPSNYDYRRVHAGPPSFLERWEPG